MFFVTIGHCLVHETKKRREEENKKTILDSMLFPTNE